MFEVFSCFRLLVHLIMSTPVVTFLLLLHAHTHAYTDIHTRTFSSLGGLRVHVEGEPRLISPGQLSPGIQLLNEDWEPHGRPTKTHKPARYGPVGNLRGGGKHCRPQRVTAQLKIKEGRTRSIHQEYDGKDGEVKSFC